jgi:hypothetical protein
MRSIRHPVPGTRQINRCSPAMNAFRADERVAAPGLKP